MILSGWAGRKIAPLSDLRCFDKELGALAFRADPNAELVNRFGKVCFRVAGSAAGIPNARTLKLEAGVAQVRVRIANSRAQARALNI